MKKLICMILTLAMALSLVACGSKETASVSTDVSTSMQKVINALGEAFMEDTGANFTYNATGSGTGISFCFRLWSHNNPGSFLKCLRNV